jgi:hypothetical protein
MVLNRVAYARTREKEEHALVKDLPVLCGYKGAVEDTSVVNFNWPTAELHRTHGRKNLLGKHEFRVKVLDILAEHWVAADMHFHIAGSKLYPGFTSLKLRAILRILHVSGDFR